VIISAMSVISPYGIGTDSFASGVRAGTPGLSTVDVEEDVPYSEAGAVHGFDVRDVLDDNKVLKSLGRPGGMAVGAVAMLMREHDLTVFEPAERGLVLGGDLITTDRAMDIMRDSLTQDKPYDINVKQFPGSVMNHPAAQCAIRFDFKGPNSTVAAGRVTGLAVLNYARRLHRAGRAPVVLAGAVEDLNTRRSWITWHGHGEHSSAPLGEGCCMFLTESRSSALENGRTPVAEVLALRFASARSSFTVTETLRRQISHALNIAGVVASDVSMSVVSGVPGDDEHAAVAAALGQDARVLYPTQLIGDTDGATAAFQLATAIAHSDEHSRIALVTAVDPDGQIGCGVFRILSS
jgi:3-oxoacyl-[acyl-carrier-protein] synthase II